MGNFNIEPYWVEGLPTASGKFGQDNKFLYHYSVAVRKKGSMYESLFWLYDENIVLNTYPNSSRKIERDNRTGQLLKGPVFLKVDSGPGRLSKSKDIFDFRQKMWERRIIIVLGLPNTTGTNVVHTYRHTNTKTVT